MKRRTYQQEKGVGLDVIQVSNKTIVLPFDENSYSDLLKDKAGYKAYIDKQIKEHPELFPDCITEGWSLYGFTQSSVKQEMNFRRIQTKEDKKVWQIRPSFVMPYMTSDTRTAEKIIFLSLWAPAWALARVFDKDVMTVYRLKTSVGRYNIVGTTVKSESLIPEDLVADEKHCSISGEKVYIATTVSKDCFLGVSISTSAGEEELTEAYKQFKNEAQEVKPDYQPKTVNTDGWKATMNAWKTLFPAIYIIQCFLHAILSIKNVTKKATTELYEQILEKAWQAYKAKTKRSFSQRLRRLTEWGKTLGESQLKEKLLKLCGKKEWFLPAYDFSNCLRTSNMVDRLMRKIDKYLFAKQYFHGTLSSAQLGIRATCLIFNFRPYNPVTEKSTKKINSAFARLNGFTYHDCWLQNLLIATSIQEIYRFQQKKL
jgi:hypothetical protein